MTPKMVPLTPELHSYLVAHGSPPDVVLLDLAGETRRLLPDDAMMQIGPEQGAFMTILTRIVGARQAVEVGTFTGYSALCIARGLTDGGRLLCCDVSEEYTAVARRYWQRAGVADRIELRIAPALDTLRALPAEPLHDQAFIDAHTERYLEYWTEIVPRTRAGGVILDDNTLWHGQVLADDSDSETAAIKHFNDRVVTDERVDLVMLPIGDGLTLARRR
jgi:caffeoyl-CoA O-methyltransferase